jgi:hypothetical protein
MVKTPQIRNPGLTDAECQWIQWVPVVARVSVGAWYADRCQRIARADQPRS